MPPTPFALQFAPEVVDHLRAIERRHHSLIRQVLNEQLTFTPDVQTRNRKPMEPPAPLDATWELRFGPGNQFRAFYEVDSAERVVRVLAIGVKRRNRLVIGREELEP